MEKIWESDEMHTIQIQPEWPLADLLRQEGIINLRDLDPHLGIDSITIKNRAKALRDSGQNVYAVMGCRKIWNSWMIRMKVFGPYYKRHMKPRSKDLDPTWNAKTMLKQKGVFEWVQVCRLLPLNRDPFRYLAKNNRNAKAEMGIWKGRKERRFLVDMAIFGPWLENTWAVKEGVNLW